MTDFATLAVASVAGASLLQAAAGTVALRRFLARPRPTTDSLPPVTILKPLYGDEPFLEDALASFCTQDYPEFQVVLGVGSPADPALPIARRLEARFSHVDVVVDGTRHGRNGKVGNLLNMQAAARHDVLVISDSDIHAPPDLLRSVAATLALPGTGLVTTLYAGLAADEGFWSRTGAAYINHDFLPGALMARQLGRQDCLGAVMALHRETLARIGGLQALADHVADDALLGQLVRAQGLSVALADVVPATTVQETAAEPLWTHELRWMRTVKSVAPVGFVLSSLQYPLFWAVLTLAVSGFEGWAWAAFATAWLLRGACATALDHMLATASPALRRRTPLTIWALPLRDLLSVAVMAASYVSNRVAWRGQTHQITSFSRAILQPGKG